MTIQNDISAGLNKNKATNAEEILKSVELASGFTSGKLLGESKWWNSSLVGAQHYSGVINGKPAVLKLQLVKIDSPEVSLIENYHKNNRSSHIRAPYIYFHKPWSDLDNYEAIVMESVDKNPVINYPSSKKEIEDFHFFYKEYKTLTDVSKPWLEKPNSVSVEDAVVKKFAKWRDLRKDVVKNPDILTAADEELIKKGVASLVDIYKNGVDMEFVHGHFGPQDLSRVGNDSAVVFSNLYWSWRYPYYDLAFGFHYFKFFLASNVAVTSEIYKENTKTWYECMLKTAKELGNFNERLFNAAVLERLLAGLNLDYLSIDSSKPLLPLLLEDTRESISALVENRR